MSSRELPAPELVGFSLVRRLGAGGFSDVFLFQQRLPRREVAVKVLRAEVVSEVERDRFEGEANLMAAVSDHPCIVTIYQADVALDGRPFFVMEFCPGPTLSSRYKQARLSVGEALAVGVQISSAVSAAHSAGIVHRDIKPANVLTSQYGKPLLSDFGISSLHDAGLSIDGGEGSGSSGFSVPWSPPEVFEDPVVQDVRSDVFSLAATIYTVLAGFTPFEVKGAANRREDLIPRIRQGVLNPIGRRDVPDAVQRVLAKAMDPDPARRFASALELGRALQGVELELGYAATPFETVGLVQTRPEPSDTPSGEETVLRTTVARGVSSHTEPEPEPEPEPKPQAEPESVPKPSFSIDSVRPHTPRPTAQPLVPERPPKPEPPVLAAVVAAVGGLFALLLQLTNVALQAVVGKQSPFAGFDFFIPVLFLAIAFAIVLAIVILVLLPRLVDWWATIVASLLSSIFVASVVYFGSIGMILLSNGVILNTPAEAAVRFSGLLVDPFIIIATFLAREVSI